MLFSFPQRLPSTFLFEVIKHSVLDSRFSLYVFIIKEKHRVKGGFVPHILYARRNIRREYEKKLLIGQNLSSSLDIFFILKRSKKFI